MAKDKVQLRPDSKPAPAPLFVLPTPDEPGPTSAQDDDSAGSCPICHGVGIEIVQGKGARRCACQLQRRQARLLESARIPKRYRHCTLSNFYNVTNNGTIWRAFGEAQRLRDSYPAVELGLIFMGSVGVGKTHLSVAILQGLIEKGVPCLFYEFGSLLKEIQNSYSPIAQTSELKVLAPVLETEVLVLDELGATKPTDWVRDTMMQIINTRYNEQRLTVFTTNYLDERRKPGEETLEDRIGVRLRSRLFEMCRTVMLDGEDYRKKVIAE